MTALPVAFYLKELSGEASRRRGLGALDPETASDLDFQVKEAHARGVVEGRAAVQAEQEAAVAAKAAAFEQALASEREKWVREQGEHLGILIGRAIEDLETRISDLVADTLKPILREQMRIKAVAELGHSLNDMLSKGTYAKITVSGPADLLERAKAHIVGHEGLSFVAAESVDVIVRADETILATQIGTWAEAISGSDP